MPAGGGVTKPVPERLFFAKGADGKAAYEAAIAEYTYTSKELADNAKQVPLARCGRVRCVWACGCARRVGAWPLAC